jgi:hypothetical protein
MEQGIWPVIIGKIRSHLVLDSNNKQVHLVHRGGMSGPTTPENIVSQASRNQNGFSDFGDKWGATNPEIGF